MIKASRNNHNNYFFIFGNCHFDKGIFPECVGGEERGGKSLRPEFILLPGHNTPPPPPPQHPPTTTLMLYTNTQPHSPLYEDDSGYILARVLCVRSQTRKQGEYNRKTGFIKIFCSLCLLAIVKRPSIVGGWPPSSL